MNYFELFELEPGFQVDETHLRNNYYRLSRLYHPDLQNNDSDKSEALIRSGEINQAYRTLSSFDLRVPYFLTLSGYLNQDEKHSLAPDFLMEMMDYNDRILEVTEEEERSALKLEIEELHAQNKKMLEEKCLQFDAQKDPSLLNQVREYYHRGKYIHRLTQQLIMDN